MNKKNLLLNSLMLFVALMTSVYANAATVDDIALIKNSYVLVCDDLGARPGKGVLFGDNHFLDVTGGSVATNKGMVNLSVVDTLGLDNTPLYVTQEIVDKYGADYSGEHYNYLRLKNAQDVIAMKLTAKSKVVMFISGNNKVGKDARIPKIAMDAKLEKPLNPAPTADHPATVSGFRWEYTVDNDGLYYIGSYNGDMFVSFIIVEVNEAPGTPTVKVGEQQFEDGLWFREVTCNANDYMMEGSLEGIPTVVTYTTDGSTPNAASPVYTEPIRCYADMTVKFQAYQDMMSNGTPMEDFICTNADKEAYVSFSFDAPTIEANGATFTVTTPYGERNGVNFYTLNGAKAVQGDGTTLTESATVSAYTQIVNGDYGVFTSKSTATDIFVLNPIKEAKKIEVSGDVVYYEDYDIYRVENGTISANPADFFVKDPDFGAVMYDTYQVNGQDVYIKMSTTNITFLVAEGDSVNVKVTCSKNACKNIDAVDEEDGSAVLDRKCFVNVDGINYCHLDAEGNEAADLKLYPDANIIEFTLGSGYHTFQKYSGTGNILISSIEITPVNNSGPVIPEKVWTIAGSEDVLGSNWDNEDTANDMTALGDGTYQLVKKGVELYADMEYEFKVLANHSWDENYGMNGEASGRNCFFTVDEDGTYDVTFVWIDEIKELYAVAERVNYSAGKMGDANNDGQVTMGDVVAIVNHVLGRPNVSFNFNNADVNGNGEVTMADVVGVVNIVLGRTVAGARGAEKTTLVPGSLTLKAEADRMSVKLDNTAAYTAFQMDVTLPEGMSLNDVAYAGRQSSSHSLMMSELENGKVRIAGWSANNAELKGNSGELLSLVLAGAQTVGAVTIDNIRFVTAEGVEHAFAAVEAFGETTGIGLTPALSEGEGVVYDLQGRKVNSKTLKGLYILDGKKSVKK